ncbi:MAG TPA: hypothetical protein VN329_09165, partial [Roseomonas sp.]|nr:hypothetical protein [Roseomonas sp.]
MSTRHRITIGCTALALALSMAGGAFAQASAQGSDDHAAHHPGGEQQTAQAAPQPAPVAPSAPAPAAPAPGVPAMGRPGGMMMPGG